jgi:hypothetical protein
MSTTLFAPQGLGEKKGEKQVAKNKVVNEMMKRKSLCFFMYVKVPLVGPSPLQN